MFSGRVHEAIAPAHWFWRLFQAGHSRRALVHLNARCCKEVMERRLASRYQGVSHVKASGKWQAVFQAARFLLSVQLAPAGCTRTAQGSRLGTFASDWLGCRVVDLRGPSSPHCAPGAESCPSDTRGSRGGRDQREGWQGQSSEGAVRCGASVRFWSPQSLQLLPRNEKVP